MEFVNKFTIAICKKKTIRVTIIIISIIINKICAGQSLDYDRESLLQIKENS